MALLLSVVGRYCEPEYLFAYWMGDWGGGVGFLTPECMTRRPSDLLSAGQSCDCMFKPGRP